jgi:sigma-B regulation protein RsbQ
MHYNDIIKRNNVTIRGAGEEAIMFAHGFGCDQNSWRHILPAFEKDYQVVSFDYVGAGKSDLSAYNSKRYALLDGYADDIIEVCSALSLNRVILVGHSVSCMVAVIAALKAPAIFRNLIFVSPSPYFFRDGDYFGGLEKTDVDALFEMMDNNYLGWSSMLAPAIMGNPDRPELGEDLTNSFCSTDPTIAREFARAVFYSDNRKYLPQLRVNSLTLQCEQDMLAPLVIATYINDHTPGNSIINLKATGHCPHLSAPEEVVSSIRQYLENELPILAGSDDRNKNEQ